MKARQRFGNGLVAIGSAIALILASQSYAQQSGAGSDSNPTLNPSPGEVTAPPNLRPGPSSNAIDPLPPPGPPPQNWIYFTPQDENTSATVIFLVNTNNVAVTVPLQTFNINGSLTINTTIPIPANAMVRICSDTVTTVSASWANVILVNFTTFSAYAKIGLPPGVTIDGYVVWNTAGFYDPLTSLQTLPLRFSTSDGRAF